MKEVGKHPWVKQNLLGKGWKVEIVVNDKEDLNTTVDYDWVG